MLIYLKISKKNTLITQGNKKIKCGRWDLNPHDRIDHKILSLARLPVPTLPHTFQTQDI